MALDAPIGSAIVRRPLVRHWVLGGFGGQYSMTRLACSWRFGSLLMLAPVVLVGSLLTSRAPWSFARAQTAAATSGAAEEPFPLPPELQGVDLLRQTAEEAAAKSNGCVACHANSHDPHNKATVHLGCSDCHGGDPNCPLKEKAHVLPRFPGAW